MPTGRKEIRMQVTFKDDEILCHLCVQWFIDHDIDPHDESQLKAGIKAYSDYVMHTLCVLGEVDIEERGDEV